MADIEDYLKDWVSLATDIKNYLKNINSLEATIKSHLANISSAADSVSTEIGKVRSKAETYLPKLGEINTTLTNIKGVEDQIKTGMGDIKGYLDTIKTKAANLDSIATYLSNSQGFLSGMNTKLESIKTSITDNLGKLSKLDSLSTIVTKIGDLETSIKSLSFEVPEISLDDTALVEEMKKHTTQILQLNNTIKSMDANFQNVGNKLGILENINDNLINQITLQQYGINLLSSNIPMAQEYFNLATRMNKINDLGFKLLSFKVSPLEYIDQFNNIMEQTYSLSIPGMPDIFISRPTPVIPEETEPVRPGDVDIITGDILGPGGIPGESIVSDTTIIDTERQQEAETSLGDLAQPGSTGETPGTGTITPGSLPEGGTIGAYIDKSGKLIIVGQNGMIDTGL